MQFEPRMSQTGAKADEWIAIAPGTEGLVALAIGRLAAAARGASLPPAFVNVNAAEIASRAGVKLETLQRLAGLFAGAEHALAIPGGSGLGQSNGLQTAQAVLALNVLAGNLGQPGGVFLSPDAVLTGDYHRPASLNEMSAFVEKLKSGGVKVLLVHGVNPVFELPRSLGFAEALSKVPQVISFATFPDETAAAADYIFPDHHGLESWGYQQIATGTSSAVLSGAQPVVSPFHNTRATADVLLASAQKIGGKLGAALPFKDEVEFIQSKLAVLVGADDGFFSAAEINTFTANFQQYGGWWKTTDDLKTLSGAEVLNRSIQVDEARFSEGEFFLIPYVSPILGEAGANKPWLQEVPDPTTTVMWNSWVEINPATAEELGLENDDVVLISSETGALEASVYKYPAIRPDTVAIPFGQGHSAYGQFAAGRGVNPTDLLGARFNEAGDLMFAGVKVKVEKTGRKRPLSRLEGVLGVYGFDAR